MSSVKFRRKANKEIADTGIECGLEPSSWTPPPGWSGPITYQKMEGGRIIFLPPGTRITTRYSQ